MIEAKLYQATQTLPKPLSSFSQIEEKAYRSKRIPSFSIRRYRMAAAILVCVFLLMGSTVIAATTEVNYSAWAASSNSFGDAERIADKLGVVLPETIGDSPFYNITTMYVVPEGTTYLEALITPVYRWYCVDYGVQDVVRKHYSDDPDSGFSESSVTYDEYSLSVGSAKGELWNYVFSLDESGIWTPDDSLPGSYRTADYNGITMQIGTTVQYDGEIDSEIFAYHHRVIWVDTNNSAVFVLHKSFYAEEDAADQLPDEMIEFAKEIIDLNTFDNYVYES